MSSASRQPPNCHLIVHGTVPSICCLDTNYPGVEFVHPGAQGYEGVHSGGSQSRLHLSIQFASSVKFLLVGKKDRGLRPYIDYRALNLQTFKIPYPLPLVPTTLEELSGHAFSLSWTCEVRTTSFGSGKAISYSATNWQQELAFSKCFEFSILLLANLLQTSSE